MAGIFKKYMVIQIYGVNIRAMKTKLITLALAIIATAITSCGTGTTLFFGPDGITITPPSAPIVIPTK